MIAAVYPPGVWQSSRQVLQLVNELNSMTLDKLSCSGIKKKRMNTATQNTKKKTEKIKEKKDN